MPFPAVDPAKNPAMDDDSSHVATARIGFRDGVLHQLWVPCDWAAHVPEWRPVDDYSDAPAPEPAPAG